MKKYTEFVNEYITSTGRWGNTGAGVDYEKTPSSQRERGAFNKS